MTDISFKIKTSEFLEVLPIDIKKSIALLIFLNKVWELRIDEDDLNVYCFDVNSREWEKFSHSDQREHLVLTDEEANQAVKEDIEVILFSFDSEFIVRTCKLDSKYVKILTRLSEESCEEANELIKLLIDKSIGFDKFVQFTIEADGRGHFLSHYDGVENEIVIGQTPIFIYIV